MSATGQDHQDQAREAQLRRGRELLQEQLRRDEQERMDQQERQRIQREQEMSTTAENWTLIDA